MAKGSSSSSSSGSGNNMTGRRSSSRTPKPYDANNSFVKKVATKVTDLIPQRSWISKWFNTSQGNGDVLDDTENAEEVESEEDIQQPPPAKKPRIRMDVTHPPGTFSIQPRVKSSLNKEDSAKLEYHDTSEDFTEPAPAGPSGMGRLISSTPAVEPDVRHVATRRSELNSLVTTSNNGNINGTDDNSESSESTSGCSSLIPQTNRQEAPTNASYSSPFSNKKRFMDEKLNFTNHMQSPRSLFLESNARDSLSNRRPSFNASVMTNTLDRASPLSSPFYSGNTTFGGASAAGLYKRGRGLFNNTNEPQLKIPRRTNVEVKPSNETGVDSSGMSQTAKKILEALEHFSSPISDAKKIPLKNLNNTITPSPSKKRQRDEVALPSARVGLRHMTRELTVPTVADILKLKRRQKLQDTTVAARKIVSARSEAPPPPPQEYHIRTEADEGTKHHGKLRAKAKVNIEEEETVETVNLPSIPLPISSLPNFNFVTPLNPIATNQKVPKKEEAFTFASPIKVTSAAKSLKSINNFTFSSPVRADGKPALDNANDTCAPRKTTGEFVAPTVSATTTPAQNFMWSGSSTAPRPKKKVKDQETPAVGLGAATELKTGSVMDILGAKPNNASASSAEKSKMDAKKDSKGSPTENIKDNASVGTTASTSFASATIVWECSECLIKNNISKSDCFVCKAPKPSQRNDNVPEPACKSGSASEWKPAASDSFGSQFKLSSDQWECSACCVRNKQTDTKCVACTTPKPAGKAETGCTATTKPTTPDLSTKIKPTEDTWECFGCKMKNNKNATTCSYCTTAKPEKVASSAANKTKDGEGSSVARKDDASTSSPAPQSSSTGFADKFKTNTMDSWECPCCLVRNASSADSCPCCTTAKPSATPTVPKKTQPLPVNGFGNKFKKPEGSWTCDACMVQNDSKTTKCVACTTPKPGTSEEGESAKKDDATPASVPTFGMPVSSGPFKFGIDKAADQKTDGVTCTNGFKFGVNKTSETGQFKFGVQKEENKDSTKYEIPGFGTAKPLGTGFVFRPSATTNAEKGTASQDSEKPEKKPCFTFGVPKSEDTTNTPVSTEKQNQTASVSATANVPSVPSFTFGVPKSDVKETTVNNKKPDADVSARSTQTTAPTLFSTANTNILAATAAAPATVQNNNTQEVKPTTGFQFGLPSGTTASNSGAATSTTTTAATLPSSVQSSFTFTATKPVAQPSLPTFAQITAPTPATTLSSTFALGENKTVETTASLLNKNNPLALPTDPAKPIFPNVSNTPSLFGNTETKPAPAFATEENKPTNFATEPAKPTFGLSENKVPAFGTTENKPSLFGSSESKMPVFGATDKPTPVFNPTPQTTPAIAPPAFGSSTASTPLFGSNTSVFQSNNPPAFGSGTTPSIFPTTKTETNTAASSNLFTFGTTPGQPAPPQGPGFSFSENTNRTGTTQEPLFTFGNNANTGQNNSLFGSNTFNSPAQPNTGGFTFNAPKMEPPTFGQSTSGPTLFGSAENNAQSQPAPPSFAATPSSSTGFNFGQTAPTTSAGGFNFSAMAPNTAPSGGFNINPPRTTSTGGFNFNPPSATPTFDPNTPPSFNFTGGSVPAAFSARPQPYAAPRKIKKAVRRRN